MIKLQNVSKSYFLGEEEVKAVSDVTLEIKEKEYISILGSSGSGKSTLMYLIGILILLPIRLIMAQGRRFSFLTTSLPRDCPMGYMR